MQNNNTPTFPHKTTLSLGKVSIRCRFKRTPEVTVVYSPAMSDDVDNGENFQDWY